MKRQRGATTRPLCFCENVRIIHIKFLGVWNDPVNYLLKSVNFSRFFGQCPKCPNKIICG